MEKDIFEDFNPKDYLEEFYKNKPEDDLGEDFTLHWFQMIYDYLKPTGRYLEFGGGPSIYPLISLSKYVSEITFSDSLTSNLKEVEEWVGGGGHDWNPYIRRALQFEGEEFSQECVHKRKSLICEKIKTLRQLDQRKPNSGDCYDIVAANFVSDSTTSSYGDFAQNTKNILTYLKPGGLFVMSVLKESDDYVVGERTFPATYITEDILKCLLNEAGVDVLKMASLTTNDSDRHVGGYIFSVGRKTKVEIL